MTRDRDDGRPDGGDRPRKSWREIDAGRDRAGSRGARPEERRPTTAAARERAAAATRTYLRDVEGTLFSRAKAGGEGASLARALRDALGTPELDAACRAYRDALGVPEDPALLALFLDARDPGIVVEALRSAAARIVAGAFPRTRGLESRLRMLAGSPDDAVAEAAETILDSLSGID